MFPWQMKMEDERANANAVSGLTNSIASAANPLAVDERAIATAQVLDRHGKLTHAKETVVAAHRMLVVNADPHPALWVAAEQVFSRAENQPGVLPSAPDHVECNVHGSVDRAQNRRT